MKAETLKRLFRSIQRQPSEDLLKVARTILDEETRKGHGYLATELGTLLESASLPKEAENSLSSPNVVNQSPVLRTSTSAKRVTELPVSRRLQLPLMVEVYREELRHDMTLPKQVEERFCRIEKEFVARERLASYGLKPRQKILFYGPPGCGKSMGAERLAWDIGLPFYKVRFESMISSFLGESANNLRTIFDTIQQRPCVLLLDECDFIAKSRTYGQDVGEMYRLVNMLLFLLEEYSAPGLLIATTNLEGALDKALFRRFDEVLEIPKPGASEIEHILRSTLSALDTSPKLKWAKLASEMDGFSAAQVVKVATDAAKQCVVNGERMVTINHINRTLSEVVNLENNDNAFPPPSTSAA